MSFVPLHPVMFAGQGLQVAAGATSFATSRARGKACVQKANDEIFLPRSLRCKVLKTKKMLAAIGHLGDRLELPPLERDVADNGYEVGAGTGSIPGSGRGLYEDPSMRRVRALGDRVAALQTEGLPQPIIPEGLWKKFGLKEAVRRDQKMHKDLMKEREKGFSGKEKEQHKVEQERQKMERNLEKLEREKDEEIRKKESKLDGRKGQDPKERVKIQREVQKEVEKFEREVEKVRREGEREIGKKLREGHKEGKKGDDKEQKVAGRVFWIVIQREEVLTQVGMPDEDVESLESN